MSASSPRSRHSPTTVEPRRRESMRDAVGHPRCLDAGSATGFRAGRDARPGRECASGRRSSMPRAVPHFTPAERAARGKAARGELPRSAHAGWEPAPRRTDPVDLLEEQAQTRLPELGPIRYGRMLVVAVRVLPRRGLSDGGRPRGRARTGLHAQLCGDAHLSNFGVFARPRPEARLQHQRLRRDAAGAVRVGRQAARGERRGRRPGARLRRGDAPR